VDSGFIYAQLLCDLALNQFKIHPALSDMLTEGLGFQWISFGFWSLASLRRLAKWQRNHAVADSMVR
jgi:hypothetical protein